ncbi:flagellar protein FlaG [Niallia circulans]|nr:flagellar protein FlaG [Niallia circulans]AYV73771.1 flagellar biosynthesis protein FlaG [Niallia circulans]SPT85219.1 flagellar protein FlaG [Niallia circulans]
MKLEMNQQQSTISNLVNSTRNDNEISLNNRDYTKLVDTLSEESTNILKKEKAEEIVTSINEFLKPHYTSINFKVHDETERYYIEVVDKATEKVIREIPSKELLDIYAKMTEFIGIFIDKKL